MSELSAWLDKIGATMINYAMARELPSAFVYLRHADGRQERHRMKGGGSDHAREMRSLAVINESAVMIALCTETWMPRADLPLDDPDLRMLLMGEYHAVSDMPREKYTDGLILYGEHVRGESSTRAWRFRYGPRGQRRIGFDVADAPTPEEGGANRFYPVFLAQHYLREIETGRSDTGIPPEILRVGRSLAANLSHEERLNGLRKAVAWLLLAGGGGSSADFHERVHANTREAIDYFAREARNQ